MFLIHRKAVVIMMDIMNVTLANGETRNIIIRDGYAFVLTGTDSNAAAELVEVTKLTEVQKGSAIAVENYKDVPLGESLYEEALGECTAIGAWESMLQSMAFDMPADKVYEEIRYAKANHNKFSKNFDPFGIAVNADDMYCSAIIRLTRRQFGEYAEEVLMTIADTDNKDMFISLMTQYRSVLNCIIMKKKITFDTWTDTQIRDYLTKIER